MKRIELADLPEDIARTAEALVASGRCTTTEDVVRAGVHMIAGLKNRREKLRMALADGEGVVAGRAGWLPGAERPCSLGWHVRLDEHPVDVGLELLEDYWDGEPKVGEGSGGEGYPSSGGSFRSHSMARAQSE